MTVSPRHSAARTPPTRADRAGAHAMATDPPCLPRHAVLCPRDPTSDLVDQVHHYSRTVIDAELRRLAGKVPSLRLPDLDVIDATLEELAESLLLARLRNAPRDTAPLLRCLFDTKRSEE